MNDLSLSELKKIRSLDKKKYRKEFGLYLAEGKRCVSESVANDIPIEMVVITEPFLNDPDNINLLAAVGKKTVIRIVKEQDMNKISGFTTPPGILAVVPMPQYSGQIPPLERGGNCVYLDRISNPGNLGSIIRTSVWMGVNNILLSPGCVDPFSPKVVQGAMGSHFNARLVSEVLPEQLVGSGYHLIASSMSGESLHIIDEIPAPWILMLGSEAFGLSAELIDGAATKLSIPKIGAGESLNVSVACGILLSHLCQ